MTHDFESTIPFRVIDHYELETESMILKNRKQIEIRREDLSYFDFDKERIKEFIRFITYRIKVGKDLDRISREYTVQNLLRFPGEY